MCQGPLNSKRHSKEETRWFDSRAFSHCDKTRILCFSQPVNNQRFMWLPLTLDSPEISFDTELWLEAGWELSCQQKTKSPQRLIGRFDVDSLD